MRKSRESLGKNAVELVLFALYAEGVVGQIPDEPEIELNGPAGEIPVLQLPRDQSHLDQSTRGAELREHVESRRVKGRGAQTLGQARLRFEHGDGNSRICENVRRHESRRTCSRDEHTI